MRIALSFMKKPDHIFSPKDSLFVICLLTLMSLYSNAQPVQQRNWVDTKVTYSSSAKNAIIITNSLPKGGGSVQHKGKEYQYFIFWTSIYNESPSTVELDMKFPALNFFPSKESHFMVALTKANMTSDKVPAFDYGLTDVPSLLNIASNQLKSLRIKILPKTDYWFYTPVFIHKTKWPVRAGLILNDKKLFYKITAGADTVMVPCGGIKFIQ